jgi:hypothetical protein
VRPRAARRDAGGLLVAGLGALAGLLAIRDHLDGPPPPTSLDNAARWLQPTEPVEVTAMLVWLAAVVAAGYLTAIASLVLVSATTGRPTPMRWAERLSRSVAPRLTGRAIGLGLTASVAVTASPVAAGPTDPAPPPTDDEPVTMVLLDGGPPPTAGGSIATMRRLDDDQNPGVPSSAEAEPGGVAPPTTAAEPRSTSPPSTTSRAGSTPTPRADAPGDAATPTVDGAPSVTTPPEPATTLDGVPPPDTWTIAPGEHLWHVAGETLVDHGRPADDRATMAYLHRLVEANRDRLVDPTNPDLVHPGQVMVLPPIDG